MKTGTLTRLSGLHVALALISTTVSLKATIWTVINPADGGPGTLRDVVASSASGDTVNFAVTGTIFLLSSINIPHTLYVMGPGPSSLAINAGGFDRAFVVSGSPVFISGMTISNGLVIGANGTDGGVAQNGTAGADAYGGAILSTASPLILSNCWLTGNKAIGGRGGNGGPNPAATAFAPGNGGAGGSAFGGAVYVGGNNLQNYYCTYSYNQTISGAGGTGGANQSHVVEPGGTGGPGGNYSVGGAFDSSTFTTNMECTFSGNSASGGGGGNGGTNAIAIGGAGGSGAGSEAGAIQNFAGAYLSCTIVSNSAVAGAGGLGGSGFPPGPNGTPGTGSAGGIYAYIYAGCINLMYNTILADNYADTSYSNYYATWTDEGYNFVGSEDYLPDCGFGPTTQIGTIAAPIHPLLAPLAQNGGGLPTQKVTLTGPVIDKGFSFGLTIDERGAPRPYSFGLPRPPGGDGSDIGAFERGSGDLGEGVNSNKVVLTWPAYYGDFTLQSATNLQGNWNYLSTMPLLVGGQLVVTNPMTNAMMFYRLVSP